MSEAATLVMQIRGTKQFKVLFMSYGNYNNLSRNEKSEHLSPWTSGNAWSFNPKQISVFCPKQNSNLRNNNQITLSHPNTKNRTQQITTIQLVTVVLIVLSVGLVATIAALLMI